MTLINDRVNLMLVICCSALILCNKVTNMLENEKQFIYPQGGERPGTPSERLETNHNQTI